MEMMFSPIYDKETGEKIKKSAMEETRRLIDDIFKDESLYNDADTIITKELIKEQMKKELKFKVGDRVKFLAYSPMLKSAIKYPDKGDTGLIRKIVKNNFYIVVFSWRAFCINEKYLEVVYNYKETKSGENK